MILLSAVVVVFLWFAFDFGWVLLIYAVGNLYALVLV